MTLAGRALAQVILDRGVLARIGGALGAAARAAGDDAEAVGLARAPVPPGLRGIDPTWIEAGLAGLPDRARVALAEGPADAVEVWLVRRACRRLCPLPPIDPALARPAAPIDALRMSASALRAWFAEIGRDQLAFALGDHAAAVDELGVAIARIARPPRMGQLGPRRAALARASAGAGDPFVVGVRAAAPHFEPMIARALVLRFPHPDGEAIARELTASHAAETSAWSALIAPP